jgi:hypothetical protein
VNGTYLRFALAWLVGVCVGCSSAQVHYYTLTTLPDKPLQPSQTTPAIDVRVVHTPPQFKRSELTVRTGPTEITFLDNERWASPVSDEIKGALRLELQRRAGRMAALRPALAKLTLDVDVRQFEAELGRRVLLEASWSATLSTAGQPSTGVRAETCTFQANEEVRAGYTGIVEGYQRGIRAFADAIVAGLTSPASGIDALCQQSINDH